MTALPVDYQTSGPADDSTVYSMSCTVLPSASNGALSKFAVRHLSLCRILSTRLTNKFNCCEDDETGLLLLSYWVPFQNK
jgi:hypothetical protein